MFFPNVKACLFLDPNADKDNKVVGKSGFIVGLGGTVTVVELGGGLRQRAGRHMS